MTAPGVARATAAASRSRAWAKFAVSLVLSALVLGGFSIPLGPLPSLGGLLDPTTGLWSVPFGLRVPTSQTLAVPGLSAPVTIVRDATGVPHIYARNAADGWFAMGYVHAQDRLWQMDVQYRYAAGRLSEVFGPAYLASDKLYRAIGLDRVAANAIARRSAVGGLDVTVLDAFTAGVNAYISSLDPPDYPLEFKLLGYAPEPWTVEKTVVEGGLIAWDLMGSFSDLEYDLLVQKVGATQAQELFPAYPVGTQFPIQPASVEMPTVSAAAAEDILAKVSAAGTLMPELEGIGSNNWAVLGTRTASGKPLLAADPHLQYQLPAVWYWAELQAPPFHVRGGMFPGVPGFFFGTNGYISWGETNTGADVNDFYLETLNAAHTQYLYNGTWHDLTVYDEPIGVRGGTTVPFQVFATRHGPILTEVGQTVAMESTIQYLGDEFAAILGINLAQDSWHFNESSRLWHVPAQNIIYADSNGTHGNIGIRSTGLYPIRGNFSGRLPVNGSSGRYEWIGFVPFDQEPHAFDPAEGFVTSTNQVPAPPDYPYIGSLGQFFDPGYRSRRIHALLSANDHVTLSDMESYQLDVYDVAAASVVPYILAATAGTGLGPIASEALAELSAWDFETNTTSVAATVWHTFVDNYTEATFGDEYRADNATGLMFPLFNTLEDLTVNDPTSHWFDNVTTPQVETRDDILRQAFNDTVAYLSNRLGPDVGSWSWGSVHFKEFPHPTGLKALSRGPYPSPGDEFTLNPAHGLMGTTGSSWRQVIDFSNLNASLAIYPGGQSGLPISPHYDDFLQIYLQGKYLPFRGYYASGDIPGDFVASTLTLVPG